MKSRTNPRRFAVEPLEDRWLMAGDVTAVLQHGDLLVRGDALDNQIEISQPVAGTMRVTGLDGTTVNGQAFVDLPAVTDDVRIRMHQGGEDQVTVLGPIDIAGDLRARLGHGTFTVEGSEVPIRIGGDLKIRSGPESEVTIRNDVHVTGETHIEARGAVNVVAGRAGLPDSAAAAFDDSLNIDNPYWPLVVGTTYTYEVNEVDEDTGEPFTETIIVEVLPDTRTILGVEVRVVRDRVFRDGLLIEDTFDWYAQDNNGNVWYFGEDTTSLEYDGDGNLISTTKEGSWEAGVDGGRAGILMEAAPQVGDRYYQEFQPGNVLDQGEVLALGETVTVPVGTFNNVLRTKETSAMEPDALANKFYAPGLGVIRELDFNHVTGEVFATTELISVELNGQPVTEVVPPDGFVGTNVQGEVTEGVRLDGPVWIRAEEAVIVKGTEFASKAKITSEEDVSVFESFFVKVPLVRGGEAVSLWNLDVPQGVRVRGDGDVYIFDSDFGSEVEVELGAGDNRLVVEGSAFHKLDADGGRGRNTFADMGGNAFDVLETEKMVMA